MKRYTRLKEKRIWHDYVTEIISGDKVYLKIFLNPDEYELKACDGYARGIISKTGDLYVVQNQSKETDFKYITHDSLIAFLFNKNFIKYPTTNGGHNLNYIFPVQQVRNFPVFGIGESDAHRSGINKIAREYYKLAKAKNEDLHFIAKHVHKISDEEIQKILKSK